MRKRSANVASAKGLGFVCAKAKRQQHGFICAKAKRQQQQHEGRHDVGHFGNATGRGVFTDAGQLAFLD
ncbi:hypothetical protein ACFTQ7_06785 [Lysinibacillus sp. NPDC056959]|uniref:hypothetical protein n=1 Tax=Lysinibacillus sp. NPDC056959 TaxID=3345981 RepID=UPI00363B7F26